jgi:hypothetical protein
VQAVWAQIQQFAAGIQDVPLVQIRSTLLGYEQQIVDIVASEAGVPTPTASPLAGSATPRTDATGATGTTPAPGTTSPTGAGESAAAPTSASTSDQPTDQPTGTPSDSPSGDPATTPSPEPTSTG